MTAPAVSTDQPSVPSATPLEQDIGQLFGEYSSGGETPDPEESAAGTTPAEPAEGADPGTEGASEPKAGADAASEPSDGTTPAAAPDAVEDDPFKDTTPAQYVVNGISIPVEDIRVFKEGGAVIRPESLPNVLAKLAERDTLSERVRTRDAEYTTLSKVSEWTDPSGKTYTGPEAAIEMRIGNASLFAENQLLVNDVINCEDLHAAGFLTTRTVPDGNGGTREAVIFRPDAIESLRIRNENMQIKAEQAIRAQYGKVMAEASKPAPAPLDYPKVTDALVTDLAKAAALDASVLTGADKALLARQLPAHIKNGLASLDWQELVKDRITLRTEQKANSLKLVSSTADATKKAQANMAAAARGVRSTPKAPVAAAPKAPTPQQERVQNEGDLYDALERAGAAALRGSR